MCSTQKGYGQDAKTGVESDTKELGWLEISKCVKSVLGLVMKPWLGCSDQVPQAVGAHNVQNGRQTTSRRSHCFGALSPDIFWSARESSSRNSLASDQVIKSHEANSIPSWVMIIAPFDKFVTLPDHVHNP